MRFKFGRVVINPCMLSNPVSNLMTIQELEQIEDRARRGLPIAPEKILILSAYLRDMLQAKANAEAVAYEALRQAGLKSKYDTAGMRRVS